MGSTECSAHNLGGREPPLFYGVTLTKKNKKNHGQRIWSPISSSHQSRSLSWWEDTSPAPLNASYLSLHLGLSEMLAFPILPWGGSPSIDPHQVLHRLDDPLPWLLHVILLPPSLLGIWSHDKCPATAERKLVLSTIDLEVVKLFNPSWTEPASRVAKFLCAHSFVSGMRLLIYCHGDKELIKFMGF